MYLLEGVVGRFVVVISCIGVVRQVEPVVVSGGLEIVVP